MLKVRTRFAPSPTGFLHVGGVYAALFNYAFAKKNKGRFILRIEDSDVKRHVPQAEKVIGDGFKWLGIKYNEGPDIGGKYGPYRQSQRLDLYKKYANQLVKNGLAWGDEGALRFKVLPGKTSWNDLIRGKIEFDNRQVKDFIILKSDGYPTYNFAVVVDDWLMKISHVIRAEEHISNTPRQMMIYKALGAQLPEFAHLPLLRNPDRSKISKRKNPVAISWYQQQGYLPEALVNFLCLLGWAHPSQKEIFDIKEFIEKFTFARVSTSAPIFNFNKLNWLNGVYIRKKSPKELFKSLKCFAPKEMKDTLITKTIPLVKDRLVKLSDYPSLVDFLIKEPKIDNKVLVEKGGGDKKLAKEQLTATGQKLTAIKNWKAKNLEKLFRDLACQNRWEVGKYFMATRLALTGKTATPPLFETMEVLGKEKTIKRLKAAV
jgi:glutamyl-tRNA synthetase